MHIRHKTPKELIATLNKYGAMKCKYDLQGADLRNADLRNADLRHADLWHANLRNADLRNADLRNANLRNANLWNANLRHANLRHADLRNADLRNVNLRNANLWNANLRHADLWTFQTTTYRAIYIPWQRILKIGCLEYSIDEWVKWYRRLGDENNFTDTEITQYGMFIKICAEVRD